MKVIVTKDYYIYKSKADWIRQKGKQPLTILDNVAISTELITILDTWRYYYGRRRMYRPLSVN